MRTITLFAGLALSVAGLAGTPPPAMVENQSTAPIGFEENKGQVRTIDGEAAPFVRFRLTQGNTQLFLLENGIAYQFSKAHYPQGYAELIAHAQQDRHKQDLLKALRKQVRIETYRMDMVLEGADPSARITTEGRSEDYTQYYNHDALDVHTYTKVTYHEVYPGIDWVVYTTEKGMKYDFVVRPGADPDQIRLRFEHHEELSVDHDGNLIHGNRMGRFTEERPVSFQDGKEVQTSFVLEGNVLRFALETYDRSESLTIDPARIWGTYYGGNDYEHGESCAVDAAGNVYLAGSAQATTGIADGGHQNSIAGGDDAFLVKFSAGGARQWGTYYGGSGYENVNSCAVDPSGNVYLAGETGSTDGIASGGHQSAYGGGVGLGSDAFLVKFTSNGTRLWATYYGGTVQEVVGSVAVDGSGNVYLAGTTGSTNAISSAGAHQVSKGGVGVGYDAFLVKFNSNGARQWGTYYGGESQFDDGTGCAVDNTGNIYLCGTTISATAIASGGHQNTLSGQRDAFLVKFNAAGMRMWGTYYGGTDVDWGTACATDANDNVVLVGYTLSSNGIASGGHQNTWAGSRDGFVAKFNANGTRQWATYYGGTGWDDALDCAIDANGIIYVAGTTGSSAGIASDGFQNTFGGGPGGAAGESDGFLVKFNSSGVRSWGTYYGGDQNDEGLGCTVDDAGNPFLAGSTMSANAIASDGHLNSHPSPGSTWAAFLVKLGEIPIDLGCATAPLAETEPNNGVGSSNSITYSTPISGAMGVCSTTDNTSDYFSFTPTGQGVLRVQACLSNSGPAPLNVTFHVLNSGGTTLNTVVLQAGGNNEAVAGEFEFPCRGIGSYRIVVDNPSTEYCTHYAFSYTMLDPLFGNDPEPNDGSGQGSPLTENVHQQGRIAFDGENPYDVFNIIPPTNGVMTIEVEAEHAGSNAGTMSMVLLNTVGIPIQSWNVPVGANGVAITTTVSINCRGNTTDYDIQLSSAVCGTSYRLKYTMSPPLFPNDVEPNNSTGAAILIPPSITRSGHVNFDGGDNIDLYRIDLPIDGVLNVSVEAEHAGITITDSIAVDLSVSTGTVLASWSAVIGANGVPASSSFQRNCLGASSYYLQLAGGVCGVSYRVSWTVTPGLFANDVEPNNSTAQAIPLLEATLAAGHLDFYSGDNTDQYRIDLPVDGVLNVTVEAEHVGASTTETIAARVFLSNSTELASWNGAIGAGSEPAITSFQLTCRGTTIPYYLNLMSSTCGVTYRVSWTVTPAAFANDVEPNNGVGQAILLPETETAEGHLNFFAGDNSDTYQANLTSIGRMNVTIEAEHFGAETNATVSVELFLSNGTVLQTWAAPVGPGSTATVTTLTKTCLGNTNPYYLRVASSICGTSYRIGYSVTPPVHANDVEPNNGSGQAIVLTEGQPSPGHLNFTGGDNIDVYRANLAGNGVMNVTLAAEHGGVETNATMTVQLAYSTGTVLETWTVPVGAGSIALSTVLSRPCLGTTNPLFLNVSSSICGTSYTIGYSVTPPLFANDTEPNNNFPGAPLAHDTYQEGQLRFDEALTYDVFNINAPNNGVMNFEVQAEHTGSTAGTMEVILFNTVGTPIQTWNLPVGVNGVPETSMVSVLCRSSTIDYDLRLTSGVCGTSYKLKYFMTAPVFANDVEPNNGSGNSTVMDLNTIGYDGQVGFDNQTDDDYYSFTHPGGPWSVTVSAEHAGTGEGILRLEVRNTVGVPLFGAIDLPVGGASTPLTNTFSIPELPVGTIYRLIVQNVTCGTSYRIQCSSDSDDDGVCDVYDLCGGGPEPGTLCDDGNINTIDDAINSNCICQGDFGTGVDPSDEGNTELRIWPNPATDEAWIDIGEASAAPVTVFLRDLLGRTVATMAPITANGQGYYVVHLGTFAQGSYMLELRMGGKSWSRRILKA